jgi:hypothetical protein
VLGGEVLKLLPKPQMIFPCVATHYHPLVYQRAQRRLGVDPDVPLDKRKKIVYFTRLVHYDSRLTCARVVAVCGG